LFFRLLLLQLSQFKFLTKGVGNMLGFHNFTIALVYILCILSSLLCVIYGAINWNRGGERPNEPKKVIEWQQEESKIEEGL